MKAFFKSAVFAASVFLCAGTANAQGTKNEVGTKFSNSVGEFGTAAESYVKVVRAEADESRTVARAQYFKDVVYKYLTNPRQDLKVAPNVPTNTPSQKELDEKFGVFLCGPRASYARLQSSHAYFTNISGALKDLTTNSPDKLIPLIYALSVDYDAIIDSAKNKQPLPEATDELIEQEILDPCNNDIKSYYEQVYGPFTSDGLFFGSILAIIEAFKKAVVPAFKSVLGAADRRRRNDAIKRFILDETNRNTLIATINELDIYMKTEFRNKTAASTLDAKTTFVGFFKNAKPAAELDGCADYLKLDRRIDDDKLIRTSAFELCHAAIMKAWNENMKAAATAAAKYDLNADSKLAYSSVEMRKSVEHLHAVAQGKRMNAAEAQAFLSGIIKIVSVGDQVEKALSKESLEGIGKSISKIFGDSKKSDGDAKKE